MRSLLFWDVTQLRLVVIHRSFGTTPRSHLRGSGNPFKMGLIGCPETPVTNYKFTLRNILEERRSHVCYSVWNVQHVVGGNSDPNDFILTALFLCRQEVPLNHYYIVITFIHGTYNHIHEKQPRFWGIGSGNCSVVKIYRVFHDYRA